MGIAPDLRDVSEACADQTDGSSEGIRLSLDGMAAFKVEFIDVRVATQGKYSRYDLVWQFVK